jgi:hypothetical protein
MKTKIYLSALLAIFIIVPQELQAQFKFGLHAGINFETQAEIGELWNNCEIYPGYLLGGFLEYKAGKSVSLQTEINYQTKGEKISSTAEGEDNVTKREFKYITVPLLVKETIHDAGLGDNWDLEFFAGPYAGFLLSAESRITNGSTSSSENIDDQVENSDFGALFGGGVKYHLASGRIISAELRYEMGLAKVDKQDPDLRNKGMGLTIGFSF